MGVNVFTVAGVFPIALSSPSGLEQLRATLTNGTGQDSDESGKNEDEYRCWKCGGTREVTQETADGAGDWEI